jgi:hypothetical protein
MLIFTQEAVKEETGKMRKKRWRTDPVVRLGDTP